MIGSVPNQYPTPQNQSAPGIAGVIPQYAQQVAGLNNQNVQYAQQNAVNAMKGAAVDQTTMNNLTQSQGVPSAGYYSKLLQSQLGMIQARSTPTYTPQQSALNPAGDNKTPFGSSTPSGVLSGIGQSGLGGYGGQSYVSAQLNPSGPPQNNPMQGIGQFTNQSNGVTQGYTPNQTISPYQANALGQMKPGASPQSMFSALPTQQPTGGSVIPGGGNVPTQMSTYTGQNGVTQGYSNTQTVTPYNAAVMGQLNPGASPQTMFSAQTLNQPGGNGTAGLDQASLGANSPYADIISQIF